MQIENIKTILAQTGLNSTYYSWPEKEVPQLPYLVWYMPNSINFEADNLVYKPIYSLNIELYTRTKDFKLERRIEAVFEQNGIVWEKTESYLTSERMYEVLYETSVIVEH